jgi:iduronate 2-sulfatase
MLCLSILLLLAPAAPSPNVLLVVVDDLKPALGSYGDLAALTPNLDRLASRGTIFTRAYAQQAVCGPSRVSFLTSRRPDTTRLYDFHSYWRDHAGNFTTLPQLFRQHGYHTAGLGKVFHPGIASNHSDDQPYSWSEPPYHPPTQQWKNARVCPGTDGSLHANLFCPVEVADQPGSSLPDLQTVEAARAFLGTPRQKPFFLAVGLHKPHVPHKFPREYLDFHPVDSVQLAGNGLVPDGLPGVAWAPWANLRRREDVAASGPGWPWGPLDRDMARRVKQGYYSAVTYVDRQVGRLLELVDNNTLVVVLADHGWSLGEHGEWAKFSNYEEATRVPLLLALPGSLGGFTATEVREEAAAWTACPNSVDRGCRAGLLARHRRAPGRVVDTMVELVDLLPSLADLAGLPPVPPCPVPSSGVRLCTEGRSWVPLLTGPGPAVALSQYPRPSLRPGPTSDLPSEAEIRYMGYSARWPGWRCTLWMGFLALPRPTPRPHDLVAVEVYDHARDPGEDHNLGARAGSEVLRACTGHIQRGFLDRLGVNSSLEGMLRQMERLDGREEEPRL